MLRNHLAQSLIALYLFSEAEHEYRAAIILSPDDEGLRFAHGQLLEDMQSLDQAAEEYAAASRLDPRSTRGPVALARLEASRNDAPRAATQILAAFERDRCDPKVWEAVIEIRLGMLLEAQARIDRLLELLAWGYYGSLADSKIWRTLECMKQRRRKIAEAVQLYKKCMNEQLLERQSYRDLEIELLTRLDRRDGDSSEHSDAWLDLVYAWCSSQEQKPYKTQDSSTCLPDEWASCPADSSQRSRQAPAPVAIP